MLRPKIAHQNFFKQFTFEPKDFKSKNIVAISLTFGTLLKHIFLFDNKVAGGIGALANWINNGCRTAHYLSPRNPIRLSSDANGKCWTIYNGG